MCGVVWKLPNCRAILFFHNSKKLSISSQPRKRFSSLDTVQWFLWGSVWVQSEDESNLCGPWLVKSMIDFSGRDRWEPSQLMVQNSMPSVLISSYWRGKKSTFWIAGSNCDSQVMELSFFLSQIKITPPSSFLPAIFCHIKRVINSARWWHHYWNNLTVSRLQQTTAGTTRINLHGSTKSTSFSA